MSEMIEAGIGYHDENAPLNINDRAFDLTNFSNTVRSETSQDIAEATNNSGVANFAYNTTMSIGDNVMTMATMAGVGQAGVLTSMGANAASESAKDATLRGIGAEDAVTTLGSTIADFAMNGDYSNFNRNIRSYMESGMSVQDAISAANKDLMKEMAMSAASGFVSGGVMTGGAYAVNDVTVGTEKLINENYKQDVEGVIRYKTDQSVEARGWQGMDSFPGKDDYENRVLEGSKEEILLVKLKGSSSGYFMLYDEYNAMKNADGKVSAVELCEGVQVAPWHNKKENRYEYRSEVEIL